MFHFLRDFAAGCVPVVTFQTQATKLFDGHAGHVRHGPGGKFTVSMFTHLSVLISLSVQHLEKLPLPNGLGGILDS
jgi:hypothetical protein